MRVRCKESGIQPCALERSLTSAASVSICSNRETFANPPDRLPSGRGSRRCACGSSIDILHSLKGEDSYGSHAYARIPSVGSCHDGLTSAEDCEQANNANPASLIFTAATKSALAVKPLWTHENFSCVLRFSAETVPHAGHLRLVFCGDTPTSNPPRHGSLYCN